MSLTFGHQSNNELFLFHLNIRLLHKNFDSLCDLLSKLLQKPYIIGLSETKIKDKPQINISIPGYTFLHNNSDTNADGVGLYVSDIFQFQELTFKASFSGCVSLWIKLSRLNTEINYVVGTIYRHPNTNANAFCDYLNEILSDLDMNKKYFFVLSDINIHFSSKPSNSAKAREYLNMLNANCSTSIINIPTRITSSCATVLDHIITNENRYEILPFVVNYNITDHFPIIATIKKNFNSQRH